MANSLSPAFVRLFYHTAFSPHVHTIPTLFWNPNLGTQGQGGYLNHVGAEIDAKTMIDALVDELKDFQPPTGIYDSAIIYTQLTSVSEANPVRSFSFTVPGTALAADVPASQATMTLRTDEFGLLKLMWFDAPPTTDFLPQRSLPVSGQPLDLFNVLSSVNNAWSGRDGARANQFIQISYTLNEALRRAYRLN